MNESRAPHSRADLSGARGSKIKVNSLMGAGQLLLLAPSSAKAEKDGPKLQRDTASGLKKRCCWIHQRAARGTEDTRAGTGANTPCPPARAQ